VTLGFAELASQLAASLDVTQAAERVVAAATRLFRVRRAVLFSVDQPAAAVVAVAASGEGDPARWLGRPLPLAGTLAGRAVADRHLAASTDLVGEIGPSLPGWARDLLQQEGNAAAIAVPVLAGARVAGVLVLIAPPGRTFGDDERRLLLAFADHATLALQTASVLAVSEARRHTAQTLLDTARAFGSALPLDAALELTAERAALAAAADRCTIHVRHGDRLVAAAARSAARDGATAADAALDGAPALTEVLRTGDAVVIDDAARSTLVPAAWLETGVTAAIVAPLLYREEAIGTLTLERKGRPGPWQREQIDLARAIAYQTASAIGAARAPR
jgi:GAF domain-containing protein